MSAGSVFTFLGLVAFLWAAFFTMAAEGFLFTALSPAMLLLIGLLRGAGDFLAVHPAVVPAGIMRFLAGFWLGVVAVLVMGAAYQ